MELLRCPACGLDVRSGGIYGVVRACPRCGAPLAPPRRRLGSRLRERAGRFVHHGHPPAPDWELVTRKQYEEHRLVTKRLERRSRLPSDDVPER